VYNLIFVIFIKKWECIFHIKPTLYLIV
jgi:hypothetical protein